MKVLITGGAGFLGSHIADRLLARGDEVVVIDNFATGRRDNLSPHARLRLVEGTIADTPLVNRLFDEERPEVVVHAAASYKDPDNWSEDIATNVQGGSNVARAAAAVKSVRRIVYFQTALCYGLHPKQQPIPIDYPIDPKNSSYAISKTAAEQYISLCGLDFISFRLANAYGPRNISGPLPTFFQRLTTGKQCFVMDTRRDFIFVDDLIACVLPAIDGRGRRGAYHISSGQDFSIQELFDATVAALGIRLEKPVEVRPRSADDAPTILLDPTNTRSEFGWSSTTTLRDGVAQAVAYYKEFGISQTYTHLKLETKS